MCKTARKLEKQRRFREPVEYQTPVYNIYKRKYKPCIRVRIRITFFIPLPFFAEKFTPLLNRRICERGMEFELFGRHVTYRITSCDAISSDFTLAISFLVPHDEPRRRSPLFRTKGERSVLSLHVARMRQVTSRKSPCIVRAFVVRPASRVRPRERAACKEVSARDGVKQVHDGKSRESLARQNSKSGILVFCGK